MRVLFLTLLIAPRFKVAIKKYFSEIKFDLVLYSTPPITLISAIEYVKNVITPSILNAK